MKTERKNLEKCQVELKVMLDAEEVKGLVKKTEKVFLREAQVPGFRKGKVPIEIIRREFSNKMKEEIQRSMFQDNYAKAVEEEKIEEVALIDLKDIRYDESTGGEFTAVIEVKPEFKVPAYKGLKITKNEVKITDEQVNDQVSRLRAAYAKFEDAKEGDIAQDGDFVQIDYSGMVGKKSILEINPEAKVVAEGKDFWVQIEEGRFLPEILDAIKGMKIGEVKENVTAKFDKESAPEGLKGEKAVYKITLKAFRRRILPTDAEFVEKAKAESLEKLVATMRDNMEKSAIEQETVRRENEAAELLLKKADFDVPNSQVRRAMDGYIRELAQRAQYSGVDAKYFEDNRDKIMSEAEATATKQVRLWYIVEAIAKEEKIESDKEGFGKKVIDFVLANAKN